MPNPYADTGEFPEDFAADVAADIGADLFSTGDGAVKEFDPASAPDIDHSPTPKVETAPTAKLEVGTEAQPAIVSGQNSVAKPLPKSWKKDMAPEWEKLSPAVHDYVYAREADVMRGIQTYKQGYDQWDSLVRPFSGVLQANPDVEPVQLMQSLLQSHLTLLNPQTPAAQKAQFAQKLLADYGINLSGVELQPQEQALQSQLQTMQRELLQLKGHLSQQQKRAYDEGVANQEKGVNAFFSDPKNEFVNEVEADILRFIQTGAATDLPSAYELACYANPVVRAKMLAKQQAIAPAVIPPRKKNGQFVNVDALEDAPMRTRVGSMDDTVNSIVAKHFPKH